ncbi:MAG: hypothetical protein FH749_13265 [Firmicutes bacterium]|nr:hypothetical protein [Bacillota bacterium]
MFGEILDLVIDSAEGAFIEVGVFVGAVLLLFGWVDCRYKGRLVGFIANSKRWQPLLGGLLGLTPGCGGAIFVMPLFFKGSVTFGTVVATLMATMGDSAFVLIVSSPVHWLLVSGLTLFTGVLTGYAVDQAGLGRVILAKYRRQVGENPDSASGDASVVADRSSLKLVNVFSIGFWILVSIGLILGILQLMQVDINALAIPGAGLIVGVTGTVISVLVTLWGKHLKFSGHGENSWSRTLLRNFRETAFVTTWVFIGYLLFEFLVLTAGSGDYLVGEQVVEAVLLAAGAASVFIAVAVGIIPGCGPQIIFVSLFAQGLIPFAALAANAVSQDGDALFPVLAMDRRSAFWATAINKLPALALGLIIFWVERSVEWQQITASLWSLFT